MGCRGPCSILEGRFFLLQFFFFALPLFISPLFFFLLLLLLLILHHHHFFFFFSSASPRFLPFRRLNRQSGQFLSILVIVLNQVDNDQIVKTSTRFVGEEAKQAETQS